MCDTRYYEVYVLLGEKRFSQSLNNSRSSFQVFFCTVRIYTRDIRAKSHGNSSESLIYDINYERN